MSNPGEHINDEIDLIELLQNLWDGKWVIAGVSAAALAIGGAYVALTPNSFDASITIRPLDAATVDQFRTLNDAGNPRMLWLIGRQALHLRG